MSELRTSVCAKCGNHELIHDCVELTPAEMWAIEIENELAAIVDPDGDKIVMLDDVAEFMAERENRIKAQGYYDALMERGFQHGLALRQSERYANKLEGEALPKGQLAGPDRYHKSGGE